MTEIWLVIAALSPWVGAAAAFVAASVWQARR